MESIEAYLALIEAGTIYDLFNEWDETLRDIEPQQTIVWFEEL